MADTNICPKLALSLGIRQKFLLFIPFPHAYKHQADTVLSCSVMSLCNPLDCSPPGSSVHGIIQTRILEWVATSSSRGSSWPRNWTHVFRVSCLSGEFFTRWAIWEAQADISAGLKYTSRILANHCKHLWSSVPSLWHYVSLGNTPSPQKRPSSNSSPGALNFHQILHQSFKLDNHILTLSDLELKKAS